MEAIQGVKVREFFDDCRINYEENTHPRVVDSQRLAKMEHETGWRLAKPVMLKLGKRIVMAVVPAPVQVDLAKVKMALGREDVQLAREDEFAELFVDCEVGAEPPIGVPYGVPMYVDRSLRLDPYLVFRDGTHRGTLRISTEDFLRITHPVEIDMGALEAITSNRRDPLMEDVQ